VKSRILPVLNAIGCVILTGLVVGQWRKEHTMVRQTMALEGQLRAVREQAAADVARATALELDIAVLKESIEAVQKSAEQSVAALGAKEIEVSGLQSESIAAREQLKVWEEAITARDTRLRELNRDLTATRARLDEAISKLKQVGAR
jgi:chromosome segregation ATPase